MRNTQRTRGAAIVYALVFAALLGLTGLAIFSAQSRSAKNAGTITNRALERATAEAAVEHGKALVQQAIGAHRPLETLADLNVTNDLNNLEYELDLSLAIYGDVRADLTGTREWAAARLDPLTGQPLRHLTSNINIDALALHGEWRDALVHAPPDAPPTILGVHQDGVFTKPATDDGPPIFIPFPDLNAPPTQVTARGNTSGAREEQGVLLDAAGRVWEWPLDLTDTTPPERLGILTNVTSISAGDRFALALTQNGTLYGWGQNTRGPLTPARNTMGETLPTPIPLDLPLRDAVTPTVLAAAAGEHHIVALDTLGRVWTWGANNNYQAGRSCGTTCPADTLELGNTSQIISVSAGGDRGAALAQNGNLYVWGDGHVPRILANPQGALLRINQYSLSQHEGLAITNDGQLVTFTSNIATPLELTVQIPPEQDGQPPRNTSVARADLLRAGNQYHAAIVGSALFTWPAGTTETTTATRQDSPNQPRKLPGTNIDTVHVTPGDQTLTITWAAPEDQELTYQIQHSRAARDWTHAGTTTTPHYHLDNLTNGQPHYLRLTAHNAYGEQTHEHESGPYIPAGPPETPTNGRTTPLHQALELAWDAPPNNGNPITHYRIEQSTNGTIWQTLPYEPTEPNVRVTGLENTRTYQHRVSAINTAGRSAPLTLPTGTPQGPPAPPELESATGHQQDSQPAITLTWQPAPGATSYRATISRSGSTSTATANGGDTSLTITGLQPNATYSVSLVAINQHGESRPSRSLNVTTSVTPSAPRDLTAIAAGDTMARLDWLPPSSGASVTNYRVERREPGTTWRTISTPETEAINDSSLEPGVIYQYRVAASNAAGTGAYTPHVELITALTPPGQPTAPRLLFRNQDSLTITWDAPTHAGGARSLTYLLERRPAGNPTWAQLAARHDGTTFTDATAQPGHSYDYRVTARNQQHDSEPSRITTIAAAEALTAPNQPRITGRDNLTINIEWDTSTTPGVTNYILERADQHGPFTHHATITASPGATHAYADTRVTAGTTYAYRVRAQTPDATSEPSPPSQDITALARSTAPRELTASLNHQTGRLTLSWTAPADTGGSEVIGYRIQRNSNEHGWATVEDTQDTDTTLVDGDAELGLEHSYRVAAITSLGMSHLSPYSAPTPAQLAMRVPSTPNAPTVTTAPGSATTPLITWLAPNEGGTPITHYTLERHTQTGWSQHATLPGHETQYADHTAQAGNAYQYRVSATNAAGDSQHSAPSTTYEAHPALPAPAAPTITHAGAARLNINWSPPEGVNPNTVAGYRLERRQGNSDWHVLTPNTGPDHQQYEDRELTIGEQYQYRVAAINQASITGELSQPSHSTAAATVPTAPRSATATLIADREINIQWGAPEHDGHASITGYLLQHRTSQNDQDWGAWTTIYQGQNRSHTHRELVGPNYYQYQVIALNAVGESSAAQTTRLRAQYSRTIEYEFTWNGTWCIYRVEGDAHVAGDSAWHPQDTHSWSGACAAWLNVSVSWDHKQSNPIPQCRVDATNLSGSWNVTRCRFTD